MPARATSAEVSSALTAAQAQLERAHAVITAFLQNPNPVQPSPATQPAIQPSPAGAPPPPRFINPIAPPSGANLSSAAGANTSSRTSANLSGNASISPSQLTAPAEPVPDNPPLATSQVTSPPVAALAVTPDTLTALNAVKEDVEKLLPLLAALNSGNPNLASLLPSNAGPQIAPTPTGRPSGRPAPPGGLRLSPGTR